MTILSLTNRNVRVATLAIVVGLAGVWIKSTSGNRETDDDEDDALTGEDCTSFPWEPKSQEGSGNQTSSLKKQQKQRGPSQEAQLEFLAGMAFANGGLRAPNCLCCL